MKEEAIIVLFLIASTSHISSELPSRSFAAYERSRGVSIWSLVSIIEGLVLMLSATSKLLATFLRCFATKSARAAPRAAATVPPETPTRAPARRAA